MASRARLSQKRSRERRDALLDAAIELFAEGGSRAVTHRAVAKRASMPAATTTYYFDSIDELISEALSRHIGNWIADLQVLAELPVDETMHIDHLRELIVAAFSARSTDTIRSQIAVYVAATNDPALEPKAAAALQAARQFAITLLKSVDIEAPVELADSLVHIMFGSAITRLAHGQDDTEIAETVFHAIRRLIAAWSMDDATINAALNFDTSQT